MDEIIFGEALRRITLFAITVGALTALDLFSGARFISICNKISSRKFSLDDAISRPRARIGLGVFFMVISLFLLLVVRTTR